MDLELAPSVQDAASAETEAGLGTAFVWGENSSGQLLLPTFDNPKHPASLPGIGSVVEFACGSFHAVAVTASGEVFTGKNEQLV